MKYVIFTVLVFIVMFSAFKLAVQDKSGDDKMTAAELKARLDNKDSSLVVLDVRTPEECAGPMKIINGAINIPVQVLSDRLKELDSLKGREIAVICRSGNRSAAATKILKTNGFNAKNVAGGMNAYTK